MAPTAKGAAQTVEQLLSTFQDVAPYFSTGAIDDHYVVFEELGRGRYSVVKRCVCRHSGAEFAAKFARIGRCGVTREAAFREAYVLASLQARDKRHRGIVTLHRVYDAPKHIVLVLNLAEGGELHKRLDASADGALPEDEVIPIVRQTIEAVDHLHSLNVVHCDIKPANLLLSNETDNNGDAIVMLCDFGLARVVAPGKQIKEMQGTPDYVAPEVLLFDPIGTYSDMWSIGVLAYVLLSGLSPFAGEDKNTTYMNITQGGEIDFPDEDFTNVSDSAKDFIRTLLIRDVRRRSSSSDALQHHWFNGRNGEDNSSGDTENVIAVNPLGVVDVAVGHQGGADADDVEPPRTPDSALGSVLFSDGENDASEETATVSSSAQNDSSSSDRHAAMVMNGQLSTILNASGADADDNAPLQTSMLTFQCKDALPTLMRTDATGCINVGGASSSGEDDSPNRSRDYKRLKTGDDTRETRYRSYTNLQLTVAQRSSDSFNGDRRTPTVSTCTTFELQRCRSSSHDAVTSLFAASCGSIPKRSVAIADQRRQSRRLTPFQDITKPTQQSIFVEPPRTKSAMSFRSPLRQKSAASISKQLSTISANYSDGCSKRQVTTPAATTTSTLPVTQHRVQSLARLYDTLSKTS